MSKVDQKTSSLENVLLKVAEGFRDYFCNVFERDFKKSPELSSITIDRIKMEKKIGLTGIRLVTVSFSTNLGSHRAAIAVKTIKTQKDAKETIKKIHFVSQRLSRSPMTGLSTPQVIFEGSSLIVMEGIKGSSFRESPIPATEKLRLAGRALCVLHGPEKAEPVTERFHLLPKKVIEALPINESHKNELTGLFEDHVDRITSQQMLSGACSFGDFHPGNILYEIGQHRVPIIRTHLIDPEFLETSPPVDRCEDICNFFVTQAVSEGLERTRRDLHCFLAGYNETLAHYGIGQGFNQFYEKEATLNFHLAQGILLSILNILQMPVETFGGPEAMSTEMEKRINFSRELLTDDQLQLA